MLRNFRLEALDRPGASFVFRLDQRCEEQGEECQDSHQGTMQKKSAEHLGDRRASKNSWDFIATVVFPRQLIRSQP